MTRRRAVSRPLLAVAFAVVAAALAGCASTTDTVDPGAYVNRSGDGWYRVQTPYANPTAPVVVVPPESCKSPDSMMGGPEGC